MIMYLEVSCQSKLTRPSGRLNPLKRKHLNIHISACLLMEISNMKPVCHGHVQPWCGQSECLSGLPPTWQLLVLSSWPVYLYLQLSLPPALAQLLLWAASHSQPFLLLPVWRSGHPGPLAPSPSFQPGTRPVCQSGTPVFLLRPVQPWFSADSSSGPAAPWPDRPYGWRTCPSLPEGKLYSSSPAGGLAPCSSSVAHPGGHRLWTGSPDPPPVCKVPLSLAAWGNDDNRGRKGGCDQLQQVGETGYSHSSVGPELGCRQRKKTERGSCRPRQMQEEKTCLHFIQNEQTLKRWQKCPQSSSPFLWVNTELVLNLTQPCPSVWQSGDRFTAHQSSHHEQFTTCHPVKGLLCMYRR